MLSHEIRTAFISYFEKQRHQKVDSSGLIPENDPTLLFANAGMNQFKNYFTGQVKPQFTRAVSVQKCVRAGGKHNDLENVGLTPRHHTFFEMLGNFSFGDYFKEEAIQMAWNFLTQELKIPREKLVISVHESDDETLKIWHEKIGIPRELIIKRGDVDNFWEMGDLGPCGPCTEIFYDHGKEHSHLVGNCGDLLDDEGRYVEIWNLVFMQYEKTSEGKHKLPRPCVDTGAGLERLTAVMQGVYWNYDTDIFKAIFTKLEELSGKKYHPQDEKTANAMRVIADHVRCGAMLITDGVVPSNEGRGYVLRRILRRAVRFMRDLAPQNSLEEIIPAAFSTLQAQYPFNFNKISLACEMIRSEEHAFIKTLDKGLHFLQESLKELGEDCQVFPGEKSFKLYDTYGLPADLTALILKEKGIAFDHQGHHQAMQVQRENSRQNHKGGVFSDHTEIFHQAKKECGATHFTGYDLSQNHIEAKLLKIIPLGENQQALIFDQTLCYPESGGQEGFSATVYDGENNVAEVHHTTRPIEDFIIHHCAEVSQLELGKTYTLKIDPRLRHASAKNHSATHLLQSALRKVLGDHIGQAGSYVNHQKLRFDFTHNQGLSPEELAEVEAHVNRAIEDATPVQAQVMKKEQALQQGALAFFGDKYGDEVRVVKMGEHSTEFCGGIHVVNTQEISAFKIINESSVARGIRRIEAITASELQNYYHQRHQLLEKIEKELPQGSSDLLSAFKKILEENKSLKKEMQRLKNKEQQGEFERLFTPVKTLKECSIFSAYSPQKINLKELGDQFSQKHPQGILIAASEVSSDRLSFIIKVSPTTQQKISAKELLREHAPLLNGKGGGKDDLAQGSGEKKQWENFVLSISKTIEEKLC